MAGVILVSFALLGSAFITLSYNYTVQEQRDSILHNAVYVADVLGDAVTSDTDLQGFVLKASRVRPTLESVAVVTDATVLLATQEGQILLAVDGTGEISDLTNVRIPSGVVQTIQASGSFSAMSSLGGTFSENRLGICSMLKLDHFVCSGKDHFMLTYDITAANCGNTDLFRITLFSSVASVVSIMIGIPQCLIHTVCQCQSRAARCIQFVFVMLFYDFHIKSCFCQYFCSTL